MKTHVHEQIDTAVQIDLTLSSFPPKATLAQELEQSSGKLLKLEAHSRWLFACHRSKSSSHPVQRPPAELRREENVRVPAGEERTISLYTGNHIDYLIGNHIQS